MALGFSISGVHGFGHIFALMLRGPALAARKTKEPYIPNNTSKPPFQAATLGSLSDGRARARWLHKWGSQKVALCQPRLFFDLAGGSRAATSLISIPQSPGHGKQAEASKSRVLPRISRPLESIAGRLGAFHEKNPWHGQRAMGFIDSWVTFRV